MTVVSAFIEIMATFIEAVLFVLYGKDLFIGKNMDKKMYIKAFLCVIIFTICITLCNCLAIVSQFNIIAALILITVLYKVLFNVDVKYCIALAITFVMLLVITEMFFICLISVLINNIDFVLQVLSISDYGRISFIIFIKTINIITYLFLKNKIKQSEYKIIGNYVYITSVIIGIIMTLKMMSIINETNAQMLQLGIAVMFIVFVVIIILVIYLSSSLFDNSIKLKEQEYISYKNELLEKNLQNINKLYEENSKNFHDFKSHILALETMLYNEQYDRTREYISNIAAVESYKLEFFTENEIINIVLNVKKEEIKRNGIIFEAAVDSKAGLNISDSDMCSLLSNIIDNAVEGCQKSDEKYIRLVIKQQGNMTIISALNSCAENPIENNFKTIKNGNHGWGMKIINDVAEKYNGQVISEYENGEFGIKVMLVG